MVDRPSLSKEEATYESSSKNSFKSIYKQNEAEMDAVLSTSLSSNYKTAEPFLSQPPEYEALSGGRAGEYETSTDITSLELNDADECRYISDVAVSPSQGLNTNDQWTDNTLRTSPRQIAHDLADDVTTNTQRAPHSLHNIDEDIFWTKAQGPSTFQRIITPGNGEKNTSKLGLEKAELENLDLANSGGSLLGKAVSETTAAAQRTPPSRENSNQTEHQYESKHEPTKDAKANEQQELLQNTRSSSTRKAADLIPKTLGRGGAKETIGFEDSLRKVAVANSTKSPKQNIETSDVSTWRQQLRKVGDTLLSRSKSPKMTHSPSTLGSQLPSPQSQAIFLHNERTAASSARRYEVETKEQASGAHKQMGSTDDNMENILEEIAEIAETEPKITLTGPDEDLEMPISHHICEWRSRYLGLSTAFDKLKSELDIALQHQSNPNNVEQELKTTSRHDQYNDYGIEGLTIIVHRRYREDLVLNTDLREEELADIGE